MSTRLSTAFSALANPQRLAVLEMLIAEHPEACSAGQIAQQLGLKPSTLSGYFAQLLDAGLIDQSRDGAFLYYRANLDGLTALNTDWMGGLCQGRGVPDLWDSARKVRNVLFLGRHNAGPTLMAEALLRDQAGDRFEVFSAAAMEPSTVDPDLLRVLSEDGLDTEALWPKALGDVVGDDNPPMDFVITIGQSARAARYRGEGLVFRAHWQVLPGLSPDALLTDVQARVRKFASLKIKGASIAKMHTAMDAISD